MDVGRTRVICIVNGPVTSSGVNSKIPRCIKATVANHLQYLCVVDLQPLATVASMHLGELLLTPEFVVGPYTIEITIGLVVCTWLPVETILDNETFLCMIS